MKLAHRTTRIEPFYVMEMAKAAHAIARSGAGAPMLYLNVGEPDFTAPPLVQEAALRAIQSGATQYTPALGLMCLRESISQWYGERFHLDVPARRIVVTAGASAALQLACLTTIDAGDEVLLADPCYPCNRQFVSAVDGLPRLIPATAAQRFQLDSAQVMEHWGPRTRGVLLASPSNPTGTSIAPQELRRIVQFVRERGGVCIVDEIYLGLSYEAAYGQSALALGEDVISVNSFSKYFNMTGWRLGWLVVPDALVAAVERLAQNLFICASTVAQRAALACFVPDSLREYERRRSEFKARRDFFIPALHALGLPAPVPPDGAFYAWVDCRSAAQRLGVQGSWDFAQAVMQRAHVAITPGRDFGDFETAHFARLSSASSMDQLQQAIGRLQALLQ